MFSLKYSQSKGNNFSISDDTLMKLNVHNNAMLIYIQNKFHEIPSLCYLVMAVDGKSLTLRQSKDNNSSVTDDTLMKLNEHHYGHIFSIKFKKFHSLVT